MAFKQGFYTPRHPEKYIENKKRVRHLSPEEIRTRRIANSNATVIKWGSGRFAIRYLSSWELRMHRFLDFNATVIKWSSEPFAVRYVKPTDGKIHRYYPDYWVKYRNRKGQIVQEVLEVKPSNQTRRSRRRNPKARLYEDMVYSVNLAKWSACEKFCDKYGLKFYRITEKDLFR
jgi:hypothetical protein